MTKELNGYTFPSGLTDDEVITAYRRTIKEEYLHWRDKYQRMIVLSDDQLRPQITEAL